MVPNPGTGSGLHAVRSAADDRPELQLQAWLVAYADTAPAGETAFAVLKEPRAAWAIARSVDAKGALANDIAAPPDGNGFVFVFVQSGSATAYEIQKQAERWMASRPGEPDGILEVVFRGERLLWRPGRALCIGTPQLANDMLAAVIHFSMCERELARLEQQAEAARATLEDDKHLSNDLGWRDIARRPHVDAMTRSALEMRLRFLRIDKALDAPSAALSGAAQRVFIELALLATAKNRLSRIDALIEVLLEHYKFINDRFSEYRYFFREYIVVALILLFMLAQTAIEMSRLWRDPGPPQQNALTNPAPAAPH